MIGGNRIACSSHVICLDEVDIAVNTATFVPPARFSSVWIDEDSQDILATFDNTRCIIDTNREAAWSCSDHGRTASYDGATQVGYVLHEGSTHEV